MEKNLLKFLYIKNKGYNFINEVKINKKSNNLIVFPGTHDVSDLYYFFINEKKFNTKKIFLNYIQKISLNLKIPTTFKKYLIIEI